MLAALIVLVFYVLPSVLCYGRLRADRYERGAWPLSFIPFLHYPVLVFAFMDKDEKDKWFQFRNPVKLAAKREARLRASLPEFDFTENVPRKMHIWR